MLTTIEPTLPVIEPAHTLPFRARQDKGGPLYPLLFQGLLPACDPCHTNVSLSQLDTSYHKNS